MNITTKNNKSEFKCYIFKFLVFCYFKTKYYHADPDQIVYIILVLKPGRVLTNFIILNYDSSIFWGGSLFIIHFYFFCYFKFVYKINYYCASIIQGKHLTWETNNHFICVDKIIKYYPFTYFFSIRSKLPMLLFCIKLFKRFSHFFPWILQVIDYKKKKIENVCSSICIL